ncbi:MAG: response regulator [Planctomycetaceae bacterium]|nr:response regulator [Planctomycetaceae bacterium]
MLLQLQVSRADGVAEMLCASPIAIQDTGATVPPAVFSGELASSPSSESFFSTIGFEELRPFDGNARPVRWKQWVLLANPRVPSLPLEAEITLVERQQFEQLITLLATDPAMVIRQVAEIQGTRTDLPQGLASRLCLTAGIAAIQTDRLIEATVQLMTAEALSREPYRRDVLLEVLKHRTVVCLLMGEFNEGADLARELLAMCESVESPDSVGLDPAEVVALCGRRAFLERRRGNFEVALSAYRQALTLAENSRAVTDSLELRLDIAGLMKEFAALADAEQEYETALGLARAENAFRVIVEILVEQADLSNRCGRYDLAEKQLTEAGQLARAANFPRVGARLAEVRGDLEVARGNPDGARVWYECAGGQLWFWKDEHSAQAVRAKLVQLQGSSEYALQQALNDLDRIQTLPEIQTAAYTVDRLSQIYAERGDWKRIALLGDRLRGAEERVWKQEYVRAISESAQRTIAGLEQQNARQQQELSARARGLTGTVLLLATAGLISIILALVLNSRNRAIRRMLTVNEELQRRKQLQLDIERRLAERQRCESMELMAAGIAHDFNNLLTVICGSAEVGSLVADLDQKDELFRQIQTTSIQASELTGQLVQFLGDHKGGPHATCLTSVVESVIGLLSTIVGRKGRLELLGGAPNACASIAEMHARQVLVNLVTNATDAIGDGGLIQVEVGERFLWTDDLAAMAVRAEAKSGDYLFIRVVDDGSGIDPQLIQRIFDPYFSTKSSGRGLGLASVMGIVRSCGGAMDVRRNDPHGTRFTVFLPIADHTELPAEPSAPRPLPEPVASGAWELSPHGLVLFVDDEHFVTQSMCQLLKSGGMNVLSAADASTAMQLVTEHAEEIRCVITDYSMPGENGLWLADQIRLKYPEIQLILCSGYADQLESLEKHVDAFLQKPYSGQQLLQVLRKLGCHGLSPVLTSPSPGGSREKTGPA